jgi:hypothetical protein
MPRQPNTRPTSIYWLSDTRMGVPFYCGKTVRKPSVRFARHLLDSPKWPNRKSAARIVECGAFIGIEIVEVVPACDDWAFREKAWIAELRRINPDCVNESDGGEGIPGYIHSADRRAKISAGRQGIVFSAEHRAKISAALIGRKRTPESVEKSAVPRRGKCHSPEWCARIAKSNQGKKRSETTKAALRAAWAIRRLKPVSEETRAKLSVAGKGRQRTEHTKANMREAWTRRKAAKVVDKSF